jgi:hypothetical protein
MKFQYLIDLMPVENFFKKKKLLLFLIEKENNLKLILKLK